MLPQEVVEVELAEQLLEDQFSALSSAIASVLTFWEVIDD